MLLEMIAVVIAASVLASVLILGFERLICGAADETLLDETWTAESRPVITPMNRRLSVSEHFYKVFDEKTDDLPSA